MDKVSWRHHMLGQLKNMSLSDKSNITEKLTQHTLNSPYWNEAKSIGLTVAQGFEWETRPLIEAAWEQGKEVFIPKCYPVKRELIFYKFVAYDQLETVYMNLLEPKEVAADSIHKSKIDLIIVPGLLFDYNGYRIGFGGGYYDRYLSDYPNKTLSITSQNQLRDKLPHDSFDIPVDHIITEDGLQR